MSVGELWVYVAATLVVAGGTILAVLMFPHSDPWAIQQQRDQMMSCMVKGGVAIFNAEVTVLTGCLFPPPR